jgi:ABC-type uncharacterized transport system permease subunit
MCLTSLTVLASMSWATTGIKLGLIMCIMTLGVHIAYRILDTADLSIEGTFPLGCCVVAILIFFKVPPIIATIIAMIIGSGAGFITGILHTKLKIPMILAIIINTTLAELTSIGPAKVIPNIIANIKFIIPFIIKDESSAIK